MAILSTACRICGGQGMETVTIMAIISSGGVDSQATCQCGSRREAGKSEKAFHMCSVHIGSK